MGTIYSRSVRTDTDQPDARRALLFAAYVGQLVVTIAAATVGALLLAGFTTGSASSSSYRGFGWRS